MLARSLAGPGPGVSRREIRDMTRPMSAPRTFARAIAALAVVGAFGCTKARTPQEGYHRFCKAVMAGDAPALFEALDQKSRWAWMTVQKSHREAYDIILSNYPEGPEREREVHRFERGATLGSGRALFVDEVGQGAIGGLRPLCAGDVRFDGAADSVDATAVLASGAKVALRLGPEDKSWGYAGYADDAEDRQKRALADVDQVRASAADYERAAARTAK